MQPFSRTLTFGIVLAVVVPVISLSAQATDPAIGTWKLNVAKSKYDPAPPPKSLTVTIETAGQGVDYQQRHRFREAVGVLAPEIHEAA